MQIFTPSEANRALPLVRSIVIDILEKAKEYRGYAALSENPDEDERLEALQEEIRELVGELESLGCTFKDWNFETGLVDFPAKIDGEEVLLCWKSDEPSVTHYHTHDGGFAARRPIPPDLLEESEN